MINDNSHIISASQAEFTWTDADWYFIVSFAKVNIHCINISKPI